MNINQLEFDCICKLNSPYKFTKTSFMKSHNFQTLIFLFSILFLISCKQSKQADTSMIEFTLAAAA